MNDYIVNAFTQTENNLNLEIDNLDVGCITSKNNNFNLDSEGNLTVKSVSAEQGMMSRTTIRDFIYPIGSIYMSINSTSPATLFGGTWEQIQDKFLLACGSTYNNGTTGGSSTHQHTTGDCALTVSQIPSHDHIGLWVDGTYVGWSAVESGGCINLNQYNPFSCNQSGCSQIRTNYTGEGKTHNHGDTGIASNMPPYFVVYVWKRIS